jgi:hypothetical protein
MVKPNRLKAIGRYIDEGGKFPTNIVINFKLNGLQFDQREGFGDSAAQEHYMGSIVCTVTRTLRDPRQKTARL